MEVFCHRLPLALLLAIDLHAHFNMIPYVRAPSRTPFLVYQGGGIAKGKPRRPRGAAAPSGVEAAGAGESDQDSAEGTS